MTYDASQSETIKFKSLESTNDEAQKIIANLRPEEPLWVVADEQTKGKGRGKNTWISKKGNLYCSIILPISFNIKLLPLLSCCSSIAVFDSLSVYIANTNELKIKWPNDILFNNSKLSGILIENIISNNASYSIIGIGINIAHSPTNINHESICLNDICNKSISLNNILNSLKESFYLNLSYLCKNNADFLINRFKDNSWRYQKDVKFKFNDNLISGRIIDFTNNFEIMIKTANKTQIFNSGEISFNY